MEEVSLGALRTYADSDAASDAPSETLPLVAEGSESSGGPTSGQSSDADVYAEGQLRPGPRRGDAILVGILDGNRNDPLTKTYLLRKPYQAVPLVRKGRKVQPPQSTGCW